MIYSLAAECARQQGLDSQAESLQSQANAASPLYCFPSRIEEMRLLEKNRRIYPLDERIPAYLGMLYYDRQRYEEAVLEWEAAIKLDHENPIVLRNLGIAYYNFRRDPAKANQFYEAALIANPKDARLLYESDQLWKRLQIDPNVRLSRLEQHPELVEMRDDLSACFAGLYNQTDQPERALQVIANHQFHPWEGGEGQAPEHYVQAHLLIGKRLLDQQKPSQALLQFIHAQTYPENLGEGKNPADDILIGCLSGMAYQAMNQNEQANLSFKRVVETERDLAIWNCHTPFAFYAAQALTHLGENQAAKEKFQALLDFATESLSKEAEPEFSTSRPNMEVFDEDPRQVNRIHAYYLMILAYSGLGNRASFKL